MSNQAGSAFWTCPQCGGMGSVLDSRCPQCGAVRPINPTTTIVTPINTNSPVTAPLTPIVGQVIPINQPQVQQIGQVGQAGASCTSQTQVSAICLHI